MIYKITILIIIISVFFEVVENLFPIEKMNGAIKSFSRLILLYALCKIIFDIF